MKTLAYLLTIMTLFVMSCEPAEVTPEPETFNYQSYLTGFWRLDATIKTPVFDIYEFTTSTYQVTHFAQDAVYESNNPTYWVNPLTAEITLATATYYVPTKWFPNPTKPEFEIVMVATYIEWADCTIDIVNDNQMVWIDATGTEYIFNRQ